MCITSSRFLKPSKPLNPSAKEWRPPHHLHLHPSQSAAAHSPLKLQWRRHLPPHLLTYHHMTFLPCAPHPHVWRRVAHHFTPFSSPPTLRFCEPAPPLLAGDTKHYVPQPEEKRLGTKNVSKMRSPPPATLPPRREWKPRIRRVSSSMAGSAAAATATPPRRFTHSKKVAAATVKDEKLSSSRTTVMIKNIPNQLRRDSILEFLDSLCIAHSLKYDFMYLPMDFCKLNNLGYAFVNFTSGGGALKLKGILQGYKWGTVITDKGFSYASTKICDVTWARIQGKESLVKRFQDSKFACDNPGFLPVVFDPPRGGGSNTPPVIVGGVMNHPNSKG